MQPKNAYFELLAHPAIIIPYVVSDEMASKKKTLNSIFVSIEYLSYGITAQFNRLIIKNKTGIMMKMPMFEKFGIIFSFPKSFNPSETGWNNP